MNNNRSLHSGSPIHKKRKKIQLGDCSFTIIDLIEPLSEDVAVYPGDPKPEKMIISSFQNGSCQYHAYTIGDHVFHPHGDAPNHQNKHLINNGFEFWDLNYAFNIACLIDLSQSEEISHFQNISYLHRISANHLIQYREILSDKGAFVIRTGYDKFIEKNIEHRLEKIPFLDVSAVNFILEYKKIRVIGIDSLTIDEHGSHYAHQKLSDKLIVESLVNLYSIPKKHRHYFLLQTSPIAIIGATGGPIVAYAYITDHEKRNDG